MLTKCVQILCNDGALHKLSRRQASLSWLSSVGNPSATIQQWHTIPTVFFGTQLERLGVDEELPKTLT